MCQIQSLRSQGEVEVAQVPLAEVPREIMGQMVKRVAGRRAGGWSYHDRIAVTCSNIEHVQCNKSRSLALDVDLSGASAAHSFLAVWLGKAGVLSQAEHKAYTPSRAEMRAFVEAS